MNEKKNETNKERKNTATGNFTSQNFPFKN